MPCTRPWRGPAVFPRKVMLVTRERLTLDPMSKQVFSLFMFTIINKPPSLLKLYILDHLQLKGQDLHHSQHQGHSQRKDSFDTQSPFLQDHKPTLAGGVVVLEAIQCVTFSTFPMHQCTYPYMACADQGLPIPIMNQMQKIVNSPPRVQGHGHTLPRIQRH